MTLDLSIFTYGYGDAMYYILNGNCDDHEQERLYGDDQECCRCKYHDIGGRMVD